MCNVPYRLIGLTLGPRRLVATGNVVKLVGCGTSSLEEVGHCGWALSFYSLALLPAGLSASGLWMQVASFLWFLLPCFLGCDGLYPLEL